MPDRDAAQLLHWPQNRRLSLAIQRHKDYSGVSNLPDIRVIDTMPRMSFEYRHEYVSGVVTVPGLPAAIWVHVTNRGATRGRARVVVLVATEAGNEPPVLDSGADTGDIPDVVVEPGGAWSFGASDLPRGIDVESASYWVVIRTSAASTEPAAKTPAPAPPATTWSPQSSGRSRGTTAACVKRPRCASAFGRTSAATPTSAARSSARTSSATSAE